ncbi:MAG: Uma2 family endonuclease [Candidatus Coatesbacteria bacterium]
MLKLKARKTIEDYMKLPENALAELIGGELLMTPAPPPEHQDIVTGLVTLLRQFVSERGLGKVLVSPLDVFLPSGDLVQPDIVFIRKANLGIIQDRIRGVPDLLIEVLSPDRPERDRFVKRDLYARNGVPEYWIVDPKDRTVEVFLLDAGIYGCPALYEFGDSMTSPLLPALTLSVSSIFPVG